jgi:hypothetical protein
MKILSTKASVQNVHTCEQLPQDGLVRPKHIAIECDFNGILK